MVQDHLNYKIPLSTIQLLCYQVLEVPRARNQKKVGHGAKAPLKDRTQMDKNKEEKPKFGRKMLVSISIRI